MRFCPESLHLWKNNGIAGDVRAQYKYYALMKFYECVVRQDYSWQKADKKSRRFSATTEW
jgi:hypothetical protein